MPVYSVESVGAVVRDRAKDPRLITEHKDPSFGMTTFGSIIVGSTTPVTVICDLKPR